MKKLKSTKSFTLMEMLIVIALIAVLLAIGMPTVKNALVAAKESADEATIAQAYAVWQTKVMSAEAYSALVGTKENFLLLIGSDVKLHYPDKVEYSAPTTEVVGYAIYNPEALNGGRAQRWDLFYASGD